MNLYSLVSLQGERNCSVKFMILYTLKLKFTSAKQLHIITYSNMQSIEFSS